MPAISRHLQASLPLNIEFATTHTVSICKPVSELMFHLTWPFMYPPSITLICVAYPVISCYGKLHAEARSFTAEDIHRICTPLDHRTPTSSICSLQARDVSNILLFYDLRPRGMIHCLGGEYMSDFLEFTSIDACILSLSYITVN